MAATDDPARNLLGRFGAAIASPLHVIVGYGAWGIAIVLSSWGLRHMIHRGEDRAVNRAIFAPIAIALVSVYASTHVATASGWAVCSATPCWARSLVSRRSTRPSG